MATIVTSYDAINSPLVITLSWELPDENSDSVTEYEILIQTKDGAWVEDSVDCEASVDPILSARTCDVQLTTLRSNPYLLVYNDLVVAKGRASNSKGFGHYSEPNILGARVTQ